MKCNAAVSAVPSCRLDAPSVEPKICNLPTTTRSEHTNHRSFGWHAHHFLIQTNVLQHVHNRPASTHIPLMEIGTQSSSKSSWKGLDVSQSKAPVPARHLQCSVVHLQPATPTRNRDSKSLVYESGRILIL